MMIRRVNGLCMVSLRERNAAEGKCKRRSFSPQSRGDVKLRRGMQHEVIFVSCNYPASLRLCG